jgi:hypothetical protein
MRHDMASTDRVIICDNAMVKLVVMGMRGLS